jgi:hypothetical protein
MKKLKLSLLFNIIIVVFVTFASIMMFTGIRFTSNTVVLESSRFNMFRYFTVDSNLLVGISSLIVVIYTTKFMKNKIKEIPKWVYILKELSTVSVAITFFVTALFLGPKVQTGFLSLYTNSNFFFHLVVPLLAIVSYTCFEKYKNRSIYSFYGIIPTFLYSIYYSINIIIHLDNGQVNPYYDFYNFLNGNISNIYACLPIMYLTTLAISYILIAINKKILK